MRLVLRLGAAPMELWPKIMNAAPDLRFLELKLTLADITEDCMGWLAGDPGAVWLTSPPRQTLPTLRLPSQVRVPAALRMLPLVSLRTLLPRLTYWHRDAVGQGKRALKEERSGVLAMLSHRLADAVPTLRFVAVYEAVPSTHFRKERHDGHILVAEHFPAPVHTTAAAPIQEEGDGEREVDDSGEHSELEDEPPGVVGGNTGQGSDADTLTRAATTATGATWTRTWTAMRIWIG
ncbi:hypothetical protein BD413DRAFT_252941 [Trametes elegans]|nr:hypothetical protein BD413DRAFT_252941 [Trametes elegans]